MYTGIHSPLVSKDQLEEILNDRREENLTVEAGDNYNITIEGSSDSLAGASTSVLSAVSVICSFDSKSSSGSKDYSAGSGVIYKLDKEGGDAYVITNYHVVYNSKANANDKISKDISLFLYGMEDRKDYAIPATYVGGSVQYDLAILRVTNNSILRNSIAKEATFADSDKISVLDRAIAVGNPEGGGISVTVGYVNMDSEYVDINVTDEDNVRLRVMRIDTPVNSGNSGGGLFNDRGEVIGIVNAKLKNSENIGYAIPANIVKNVADNVIYYCKDGKYLTPYRCLLGVQLIANECYTVIDTETGKVRKIEIPKIDSVDKNAIASGKLYAGDIIESVTIDGVFYKVDRLHTVIDSMLTARVGSKTVFGVNRNGESITVEIVITEDALTPWP
jgi:serine protease Do